ncbi:hypothetical protein N9L68_09320 [bacterium]|nr:hypothetical protein [bacterium]
MCQGSDFTSRLAGNMWNIAQVIPVLIAALGSVPLEEALRDNEQLVTKALDGSSTYGETMNESDSSRDDNSIVYLDSGEYAGQELCHESWQSLAWGQAYNVTNLLVCCKWQWLANITSIALTSTPHTRPRPGAHHHDLAHTLRTRHTDVSVHASSCP